MGRDFSFCVDGHSDRLTVEHGSMIKDLGSVLLMGRKDMASNTLDVYAKEMVEGAGICHGEHDGEQGGDRGEDSGGASL